MKDLNASELATIVGGTKANDQITQQLTTLSTSLQSAMSNNNNNSGSSSTMMMAMMMAMRPHNTVVADGGGAMPVAAPAPAPAGPVVNISTRVRH